MAITTFDIEDMRTNEAPLLKLSYGADSHAAQISVRIWKAGAEVVTVWDDGTRTVEFLGNDE